jgi:hypothetical protein
MGILATMKYNASFDHDNACVDHIQRDTERYLGKLQEEITAIRELNTGISDRDIFFHAAVYDGIPVDHKLGQLCYALREVNPRVKFGVRRNCALRRTGPRSSLNPVGNYMLMCEVWVYLPGQPYALMRIGYKNYTTTSSASGDPTYGVYSRLIQNRKYIDRNDQYCMLMSADIGRAIKNAKSVMRPYAPQETVQVKLREFVNTVQNETSNVNSEMHTAAISVRQHDNLLKELVNLCQNNYEFMSADLRDKVETYIRAKIHRDEHLSKVRHGWFITVLTRQDKQHFDVIEMFDVHKPQPVLHDPQTYTTETLPEEIAGKMAVLTMVDVGARVSDVGMRATETTFYVERV